MRPQRLFLLTLTLMLTHGITAAFAQQAFRRIEVAGGASILHLTRSDATAAGMTGRVSVDLTNWLSAEAEMTFFPSDDIIVRDSALSADFGVGHYRRRTDGFFGAKVGRRGARYGLFGKVRPGFTHLTNQGVRCIGEDCARILMLFAPDAYRTEFALDLGGGFEFYPSARTVARFEFGDTMIRHRSVAPPCWNETCTSHNFATRVGGGLRF
jgi:hypothetical protein